MTHAHRTTCLAVLLTLALVACGERGRHVAQERRERSTPPPSEKETAPDYEGRDAKQVLTAFPEATRRLVEEADTVTLFTLNPDRIADGALSPEAERLHTYGITGQYEISAAGERRKVVEAVYRGLLGQGAGPAACFLPRHGLRFVKDGRTLDCLICFECTWIYLYGREGSEEETRLLFGAGVEPVFASILKAHRDAKPK